MASLGPFVHSRIFLAQYILHMILKFFNKSIINNKIIEYELHKSRKAYFSHTQKPRKKVQAHLTQVSVTTT